MKKTYTLTLDPDKVEELRKWLDARGFSLSGYINQLIDEQITAIKIFAPKGDYSKVTVKTLMKMAGKMAGELKKEIKKK